MKGKSFLMTCALCGMASMLPLEGMVQEILVKSGTTVLPNTRVVVSSGDIDDANQPTFTGTTDSQGVIPLPAAGPQAFLQTVQNLKVRVVGGNFDGFVGDECTPVTSNLEINLQ